MIGPLSAADALIGLWSGLWAICVLVVDARTHRIPNRFTGAWVGGALAIGFGGALTGGWGDLGQALATGLTMSAAGYFLAVLSPEAFGLGDVKLLGCVGVTIGHLDPQLVLVWLLALAIATVLWLLIAPWADRLYDRRTPLRKRHIAFGPPIIIALALMYLAVFIAP